MVKIGIVVAKFNPEITSVMEREALLEAKRQKVQIAKVVHIPGVFEIPLAAKKMLPFVDAVVALGAVIKGGTAHDEVIAHSVSRSLLDIAIHAGKHISLGILGPKISWKQAKVRAKPYASRAIIAAVEMAKIKV